MLTERQAQTVIELFRLMERVGATPTVLRTVYGLPIPKHKAEVAERVSMRTIGLLPSLYRQWARVRQVEARK